MDNVFDSMYYQKGEHIGGIDESGVSDIAGPLVAACVILPKINIQKDNLRIFEVDDSKKIPEKYRRQHVEVIWEVALAIGIGEVSPMEFDVLGKHRSIQLAMSRSVAACKSTSSKKLMIPSFLLVDGEISPPVVVSHKNIVRGDTKSMAVAAASIVAKVYRDDIMTQYHDKYPWYDLINNKGYPCENQFLGLDEQGMQLGIHRVRSWPFVPNPKFPEGNKWEKRRKRWKEITLNRLGLELGDLWNTKSASSKG